MNETRIKTSEARIEWTGEVYGLTYAEITEAVQAACHDFFGDTPFERPSVTVEPHIIQSGTHTSTVVQYKATIHTRSVHICKPPRDIGAMTWVCSCGTVVKPSSPIKPTRIRRRSPFLRSFERILR